MVSIRSAEKAGLIPPCLLSMVIPLVLMGLWHSANGALPKGDCAMYAVRAQKIYLEYVHSGLGSALADGYLHREWKPILHPLLALPALILSHGRLVPSIAATVLLFFVVFLVFTFKLFARYLDPWRAALATSVLGTIPWILGDVCDFDSQTPLLMAFAATLFYLLESERFSKKRASALFGVWAALSLCFRPVETSLSLFVPVAALIGVAFKAKHVRPVDLLLLACELVTFASYIAVIIWLGKNPPLPDAFVWSLLLLWPVWIGVRLRALGLQKKYTPSDAFFLASSIPYVVAVAWFSPFIHDLYSWAGGCSFLASSDTARQPLAPTHLDFIRGVLNKNAGISALYLAALGLLGHHRWRILKAMTGSGLVPTCLVLAISIPILIGSVSLNGTQDYFYQTSGLLILLPLLIVALRKDAAFGRLRSGLLIPLLVAQGVFFTTASFPTGGPVQQGLSRWFVSGPWFYRPVREDPYVALLRQLQERLDTRRNLRIATIPLNGPQTPILETINLHLKETGEPPWTFNTLWGWSDPEAAANRLRVQVDYLLVSPPGGPRAPGFSLSPFSDALYGASRRELTEKGFEDLGTVEYVGYDGSAYSLRLMKVALAPILDSS